MDLNKRQRFFQERFLEILHHDTLDSYRVRIHNPHTILTELKDVVSDWIKGNVKQFETVKLCAEETLQKVKEDTIFIEKIPLKGYLCSILAQLQSGGEKNGIVFQRTIELLEEIKVQIENESLFNKIYSRLKALTLVEEDEKESLSNLDESLKQIDILLSTLCTELIYIGFSRHYLYHFVKRTFKNAKSFEEGINIFEDALNPDNIKEFKIIFRLKILKGKKKGLEDLDLQDLLREFPQQYLTDWFEERRPNFIENHNDQRYYVAQVSAFDEISAVKLGKEKLSRYLDSVHFALNYYKLIPDNQTLVLEKRDSGYYSSATQSLPFIEGLYYEDESDVEDMKIRIYKIQNSSKTSRDVINRLTAALRHLRIGDTDPELEQRFINYWIALEFLFSSPDKNENTFGRIKENLINVLVSCYGYRNLCDLEREIKLLLPSDGLEEIWNPANRTYLKDSIENSVLLSYRLRMFEKHILSGNKNEINKYLKSHEKNLLWQIARIYRLRNELIHEAAIKQNIESLTSNLRYYLNFILRKIIYFFSSDENINSEIPKEMESFFLRYDFQHNVVITEANIEMVVKYGKS